MRTATWVLASILPMALAAAPSIAHGQRITSGDCYSRFDRRATRSYDCSYDRAIAREAREAAARARSWAREAARWTRADTRAFAAAARAEARQWERTVGPHARFRADELRARLRDRMDSRFYERRSRNYLRW